MKNIKIILVIVLSVFFGCKTESTSIKETKDFDYGKVENHIYTNSFFDLKFSLPSDWAVQSKEQIDNLTKVGKDIIAGDNEPLKSAIKASEVNSANLLGLFKYEVGTATQDYNSSFMVVAENLKMMPGIKTGADYLFHAKKLLKQTQLQYSFSDEEFKEVKIGTENFYVMKANLDYAGLKIKQNYYTTIKNGFSINVILSFVSDEQKLELENVLNSLESEK